MKETCYYIIAEFKALGIKCVKYGPEFWVIVPELFALVVLFASLFNRKE